MEIFFPDTSIQEGAAQNVVINLSDRQLSNVEMRMFNKGLGYVPTSAYNLFRAQIDFLKLRLLKLRKHFGKSDSRTYSLLRRKSTFMTNISDSAIRVFDKLILRNLNRLESNRKYNLTREKNIVLKNWRRILQLSLSLPTRVAALSFSIEKTTKARF